MCARRPRPPRRAGLLTASAVGTARVTVRTGGRTIAQSVVPLFHVGAQVLPIELTRTGFAWLRTHRVVRVSVSATFRDLLAWTASASAPGTLR